MTPKTLCSAGNTAAMPLYRNIPVVCMNSYRALTDPFILRNKLNASTALIVTAMTLPNPQRQMLAMMKGKLIILNNVTINRRPTLIIIRSNARIVSLFLLKRFKAYADK